MSIKLIRKAILSIGVGVVGGIVVSRSVDAVVNALYKETEELEVKDESIEEKVTRLENEIKNNKKTALKDVTFMYVLLCAMIYLLEKEIGNVKDACMLNSMMNHDIAYYGDLVDKENVIRLYDTVSKHARNKEIRKFALNALKELKEV